MAHAPASLLRSIALVALAVGICACQVPSGRHPLAGKIRPRKGEASYAIYTDDEFLHVRVSGGERPHRFQGSVTAVKGALGALELDRPALADQVATHGASIQFDLEPQRGAEEGFRVRLDHACLRFDLYVDGARRPDRVYLGGHRTGPKQIPFERCP